MTAPAVPPPARSRAPVPRTVWVVLPGAVVVGIGLALGLPAALLALAGASLTAAVFLGYSSLVALNGEAELTLQEALTLVAPSAEEERKRSILRALKDLEYELAAGKISPVDHAELTARYRAEARRLLRLVDELQADQLARAERRVQAHLTTTRVAVATEPAAGSARRPPERASPPATGPTRRPRCPACGRRSARSARYCSGCGAPLPTPPAVPAPPSTPGDRER